jgi:DNA-binding response OmpR family regulator
VTDPFPELREDDPARVLLVEDDVEVAQAIARRLTRSGYEAVVAPTCAAAAALTCWFDVGVLDIQLPDGNGVELAEQTAARECLGAVVFFSGTDLPAPLRRARRLGPVVPKRDGIEALIPIVEGLAGRSAPTASVVVPAQSDDDSLPLGERLDTTG